MTLLKVRPVGASLGVVLPKKILARLSLKSGDYLHLSEAPDGSMRIAGYDPGFEEQMRLARRECASSATHFANSPRRGQPAAREKSAMARQCRPRRPIDFIAFLTHLYRSAESRL
jgi:antitoxin component of MazEF toxin-antitoxin module